MAVEISGSCSPRFERVRKALQESFTDHGDLGAAVAVTLRGRTVVDLWGGWMDAERGRPWARDTLVNVFSTTKGLTAACAHRLIDQGALDIDSPVARYWPEFAQAGKERLPVRYLLSHQAGLFAIEKPLPAEALYDWDTMCAALAEQKPWWEPGTKHGYHALTFGWLVGEVVRRISGMSLGTFLREEIAKPLGLDCHIGIDASYDDRIAQVIGPPPLPPELAKMWQEALSGSSLARAIDNPPTHLAASRQTVNSRQWRAAEIPAANGHCTARDLSRLYGALACGGELDGVRILSPAEIERCYDEQASGPDAVLIIPMRYGQGFMLWQPGWSFGVNKRCFGHPGAGGSAGFADPEAGFGFGYTMNQMEPEIISHLRAARLIQALYACL